MASNFSDATAEAARIAVKIGSAAADGASFMADLGEELPVVKPVLKTLKALHETVKTVKSIGEDLGSLEERCTYLTACVIVKCRVQPSSDMSVAPLTECIEAAWKFVERWSRRGRFWRVIKASSDKDEIAGLNARVDRLTRDLGLAGIATLNRKTDNVNTILVR